MSAPPDLLRTIVAATRRTTEVRREREPMAALERRAAAASPRGDQFEQALGRSVEADLQVRRANVEANLQGRQANVEANLQARQANVEADLQARQANVEANLQARQANVEAGLQARLRACVIAECKRRSPSRGVLAERYDPVAIARQYERGGAAAISVLTEPTFFDGALEHLTAVRAAVGIPLLRKDFVVDEYQLLEARAAGADAILLIVAALEQADLSRLQHRAWDLGLAALVEVHDESELARAADAGARLVGVNNRNLRTLAVDTEASYRLAARMPPAVTAVSESGLKTRADLERLAAAGYSAFLIGERFMTDPDPARAIAALIGGPQGPPLMGGPEGPPLRSVDAEGPPLTGGPEGPPLRSVDAEGLPLRSVDAVVEADLQVRLRGGA